MIEELEKPQQSSVTTQNLDYFSTLLETADQHHTILSGQLPSNLDPTFMSDPTTQQQENQTAGARTVQPSLPVLSSLIAPTRDLILDSLLSSHYLHSLLVNIITPIVQVQMAKAKIQIIEHVEKAGRRRSRGSEDRERRRGTDASRLIAGANFMEVSRSSLGGSRAGSGKKTKEQVTTVLCENKISPVNTKNEVHPENTKNDEDKNEKNERQLPINFMSSNVSSSNNKKQSEIIKEPLNLNFHNSFDYINATNFMLSEQSSVNNSVNRAAIPEKDNNESSSNLDRSSKASNSPNKLRLTKSQLAELKKLGSLTPKQSMNDVPLQQPTGKLPEQPSQSPQADMSLVLFDSMAKIALDSEQALNELHCLKAALQSYKSVIDRKINKNREEVSTALRNIEMKIARTEDRLGDIGRGSVGEEVGSDEFPGGHGEEIHELHQQLQYSPLQKKQHPGLIQTPDNFDSDAQSPNLDASGMSIPEEGHADTSINKSTLQNESIQSKIQE